MYGVATQQNEITGYFRPVGISDKIKYIDFLRENTKIRLDNKQNYLVVMIIHFLRYLKRIKKIFDEK